jgi:putative hydrolase of the HAD superfamily
MAVTTVLLDLDGVIRHFDQTHQAEVERRHGLRPGSLAETGFAPEVVTPLITGAMTRAEWQRRIGELVDSPAAAREWLTRPGEIDWELMAIVDELRTGGVTVAILTNGTDTVARELAEVGLLERLDAVFNSAEIGVAKPDRRAFEHVCRTLDVAGPEVFFTDDSASSLAGAVEIGMTVRVYEGLARFRQHLDEILDL